MKLGTNRIDAALETQKIGKAMKPARRLVLFVEEIVL
jgi:hypothetical protein